MTVFDSAYFNAFQRNPFVVLLEIANLGITLLEKDVDKRRHAEGNLLDIFATWLEFELLDDCPGFTTWDPNFAVHNNLKKE